MATTLTTMTANVPSFRSYVQRFVRMAFFFNASLSYCRLFLTTSIVIFTNNHNINIMGNWGSEDNLNLIGPTNGSFGLRERGGVK